MLASASCLPIVVKDFLMEEQDAMKEYRSGERISVSCSRNLQSSQAEENLWNYAFDDKANADRARNLTCLNGRWVGEYPECFERCRRSSIQGNLVAEPESEYLLPGDVVKIQICWGNIPVEGDGYLTCMANGSWYGNATCPPQSDSDCFTPLEVKNAYISGKRWNRYPEGAVGQYVHFRCDEGYILKGPHMMLCYADGTFHSEMMPKCLVVQCQPLKPPEHGWIEQSENDNGKTIHDFRSYAMVQCEEGYRVIGSVRRQCQADGTWSGEDAVCQIIRPVCEISPLVLRYGRFHSMDRMTIDHGARVSIRKMVKCDYGYTVPPNISYVSCYNGTLDPPNFDCIKYDYSIRQCHLSTTVGQVIRYRDKCYLATHGTFRSYHAKRFCQNLGPNAYLAMIPDKETNEAIGYLMNMAPGEKIYWFGAMWNSHTFRWEWPNGKGLNYTNWMNGEGSKTVKILNFNNCAVVISDVRWASTFCWRFQTYKAICEMAAN
ncbi:hypothetical protein CHS0354_016874 [Potamilus streckersoni]|uniref:Uncharacterized protein n=1 Tax=Potamilus streckersoni TaxID=2493646 RepID=A0AAE0S8I7_9BIVA|nr:hypothetical protein CHS0354_016874 [Potamilus streckersoni]